MGRAQCELLRDRWLEHSEFHADALISSHFRRAAETAEVIGPALTSKSPVPIVIDERFGELDPGEACDGMSFDEFNATYPESPTFPGGESLESFHLRVADAVQRTAAAHPGQTVVVFCHGGVIDSVMRYILKAPRAGGFKLAASNTSITEIVLQSPDHWQLVRYGDVAHLNRATL